MPHVKWTQEMRIFLFRALKNKFGVVDMWEHKSLIKVPGYKQFKNDMAAVMGHYSNTKITSAAIDLQIRWAITKQEQIVSNHIRTYIMCKAAALDVGLIDKSYLPGYTLIEH